MALMHYVVAVQNDVLAHRAVRGFLTHGGVNSLLEAAYHGVPVVVRPLMGEWMELHDCMAWMASVASQWRFSCNIKKNRHGDDFQSRACFFLDHVLYVVFTLPGHGMEL